MLAPIWHHHQVHQECPCPPRLQEKTWRTGGVLTWFLMSDLDQSFTDTSDGCSFPSNTISRFIRNVHVLLDSRKGGVLTWFLMSDLDETFTDTSDECFLPYETVSRSIRNTHVLLESRKRHEGQEKSWHGYWYQNLIKIPINKTKLLLKPLVH